MAALPKLLFIGNFPSFVRGSHSVSEELARKLQAIGFDVITVSHRDNKLARFADMLQTIWRRRRAYDLAHVQVFSGTAFIWAEACCALLRLLGKPYLLTLHGGNLPAFAQRRPHRVTRLLNSAVFVTTPSSYLFETMRPYCAKLKVLPNAIDIASYAYRQRTQPKPTLVWLRAFHRIYNPNLAAQVIAQILPVFPSTQLLIFGPNKGDGSLNEFQHETQRLGISDAIEVRGAVHKTSVPAALNQGDIFLNTTNIDNTPTSVIEAMACGLCVVSTNVGGIPYLLQHEENALLVPPADAQAMAAAVQRLLNDASLAARLSENARRKVESFDWPLILERWQTLFLEAAQRTRR